MKAFKPERFAAWCVSVCVVALVLMMVLAHAEPEDPEAYRDSALHRTNQALARAPRLLGHGSDCYETLSEYARKCDAATGITVPRFSCGNGTQVPGQEAHGGGRLTDATCARANVRHRLSICMGSRDKNGRQLRPVLEDVPVL